MFQQLSTKEIKLVLEKIRTKYENIITTFGKSQALLDNFNDRYFDALKKRTNITVFLLAEIEAVEEIFKNEEQKVADAEKKRKMKQGKSFIDGVMEENKRRYSKYPRVELSVDCDEEVCHLCGAIRHWLNGYYPVAVMVAKSLNNSALAKKITQSYDEFSYQIGYSGEMSVAKHYLSCVESSHDSNKVMFEYRRLIQDIGFLLNSNFTLIKELLQNIVGNQKVDALLVTLSHSKSIVATFKGKGVFDAVQLVKDELEAIIVDFRLKDIRKK